MAENNQVGEKIKKVRKCLGFSQEEFAFKVGVTKQTVSSWELGSAQPGFDKINFICQEFNIDANTFIYPIDKKNSDRKVVATTITNDIIFLPTPAVAETKSEVKQVDKTKRKIVLASLYITLGLIAISFIMSLIICIAVKMKEGISSLAINIKPYDVVMLIVIFISVNILLTSLSIFIYNKRKNHKINKQGDKVNDKD